MCPCCRRRPLPPIPFRSSVATRLRFSLSIRPIISMRSSVTLRTRSRHTSRVPLRRSCAPGQLEMTTLTSRARECSTRSGTSLFPSRHFGARSCGCSNPEDICLPLVRRAPTTFSSCRLNSVGLNSATPLPGSTLKDSRRHRTKASTSTNS